MRARTRAVQTGADRDRAPKAKQDRARPRAPENPKVDAPAGPGYTAAMTAFLLVFFGAGLGGAARHAVNLGCARWCGPDFPWGTTAVNVAGSFAMGLLAGWLALRAGEGLAQPAKLFLGVGVLGGFTTFSAFSLDAVLLWERGAAMDAALYVGGSVAGSIAALAAGLFLARSLA